MIFKKLNESTQPKERRKASDFLSSVKAYGWEDYHDGIGFKIDLLSGLDELETAKVLDWLEGLSEFDWMHAEVFGAIDSDRSTRLLTESLKKPNLRFRMTALSILLRRKSIDPLNAEEIVLDALRKMTIIDGMTDVHSMAIRLKSERIKKQVLENCINGNDDVRVHSAALVHFLYGITKTQFDDSKVTFYQEFKKPKILGRNKAYEILCREIADAGIREQEL